MIHISLNNSIADCGLPIADCRLKNWQLATGNG
jgi:hypothetical protein